MAHWTAFPHTADYAFDADGVRRNWARLHRGDAEPLPTDPQVLQAWVLFHSGQFEAAADAGLKAGGAGITVANKAACVYASYLEPKDKAGLDLLMEAAHRAGAQAAAEPDNPNAWYWHAYALARYSHGISVAKALAQGLGRKVKDALEKAMALQPAHADAHIALGAFHAEVIDKVGPLIGGMTYGASKDVGLRLFQEGLRLNPQSVIGMIEYANGLVMLEGDKRLMDATRLYEQAVAFNPLDASERLHVELAQAELEN